MSQNPECLRQAALAFKFAWPQSILDTVILSAVLFRTTERPTQDALCDCIGVTIPPNLRYTALGDVLDQTRKHGRLFEDVD